jgi:hypothetical protein
MGVPWASSMTTILQDLPGSDLLCTNVLILLCSSLAPATYANYDNNILNFFGARRRRSGGGLGGGCARAPVGILSPPRGGRWKPRSRAMLGTVGGYKGRQCDPRDSRLSGKPCTEGLKKRKMYVTGTNISRSARPICFFRTR